MNSLIDTNQPLLNRLFQSNRLKKKKKKKKEESFLIPQKHFNLRFDKFHDRADRSISPRRLAKYWQSQL